MLPTACGVVPGPPEWHGLEVAPGEEFVKLAEKQLGAAGFGPVPAASVLWQMAHAVLRFPAERWEIDAPLMARTPCQSVGWALAAGWQDAEHEVEAVPPLKLIVPGVPWHSWQKPRSAFALVPWNAGPPVRGSSHEAPVE